MPTTALIFTAVLLQLGVFVCFTDSGRMGTTFLFIASMMWIALAIFTANAVRDWNRGNRIIFSIFFLLGCVLSALSMLPQRDARSPFTKLMYSEYPGGRAVYTGLLRLGVYAPGLLPPEPPEKPQ